MTLAEKLNKDLEDYNRAYYKGITISKGPFLGTLTIGEDGLSPLMVTTDLETSFRSYCYKRVWEFNDLAGSLNKEYVPEEVDA